MILQQEKTMCNISKLVWAMEPFHGVNYINNSRYYSVQHTVESGDLKSDSMVARYFLLVRDLRHDDKQQSLSS